MGSIFILLLTIILLQNYAQAADRLRIGFSELIASYSTLPLGQKRGFLQEEGLQAEFIRMGAAPVSLQPYGEFRLKSSPVTYPALLLRSLPGLSLSRSQSFEARR
jgi:hypothetical protein